MTAPQAPALRRALLSVSDKTGIADLAEALTQMGVEIVSTGGTARLLRERRVPVQEVADYTGFPELMEGRVKTLHPKVHGGILGRRGVDDAVMADHGIPPIDLVAINLYPFESVVAGLGCPLERAIENIDIGGPAMIRAAAKNHAAVTVLVDAADYGGLIEELRRGAGRVSPDTRFRLAVKAFAHTARYDAAVADYLGSLGAAGPAGFPETLSLRLRRRQSMRYGENPHQAAAFYALPQAPAGSITCARQIQGKPLSFNNVADADTALECVRGFEDPACVIVKHANPCGAARAPELVAAYEAALRTDPTSAFGGIIAFNRELDRTTAEAIVHRQFLEVLVAPGYTKEALAALATKQNVRVLACGASPGERSPGWDFKGVNGGVLLQDRDAEVLAAGGLRPVAEREPSAGELQDLLFAWRVCRFVKSNAIVYARDGATVAVGAGQMSRVFAARIARMKASEVGLDLARAVAASDAFFPFRDGIDVLADAGATAVIQPGGSRRDDEVIAAANERGMAMVFTGMRHFRH